MSQQFIIDRLKMSKLDLESNYLYLLGCKFENACIENNLEKIKTLMSLKEIHQITGMYSESTKYSLVDYILRCASSGNNLEMIKYCLTSSDFKENANIHAYEDQAIRIACEKNNKETISYLLTSPELKEHANIHACQEQVFELLIMRNNKELIEFLILEMNITLTQKINEMLIDHHEIKKLFTIRENKKKLENMLKIKEYRNNKSEHIKI